MSQIPSEIETVTVDGTKLRYEVYLRTSRYTVVPIIYVYNHHGLPADFPSWAEAGEYQSFCDAAGLWRESGYFKQMTLREFLSRLGHT